MLKFTGTPQNYPEKRPAKKRAGDFNEIYKEYAIQKAEEQSSRCSQCGIPFCQVHCPLHNNIPDWLKLTAENRLQEAYAMSSATNTFPEICGRICPQDRLCEGNCVINKGFGAVTIGSIEKFITENAWEEGWVQPFAPEKELKASVGIIGAGPAGMAAAEMLRRQGYQVHIYDRYDRAGGLMIYGIPNFKLEKWVVERRTDWLEKSGVQFHLGQEIGKSVSFKELQSRHDAVLIATGVYKARTLGLPGMELQNIIPALEYLTASNRKGLGDKVPAFDKGGLNAEGKRVVVVGGGDTAMDCVRTAIRQGAKSVSCLYRRDKENMPGSRREVNHAEEEGVKFVWLSAPKAFRGKANKVTEVLVQRMRLNGKDASGRESIVPVEGGEYGLSADLVINALGFEPEELPMMFNEPRLKLNANGTLKVSSGAFETSLPGVYAAGDIVRGASLVVWGIADGRAAAAAIMNSLESRAVIAQTQKKEARRAAR